LLAFEKTSHGTWMCEASSKERRTMLLNFLLMTAGLAIAGFASLWALRPVRCTNPYWI
jgi:hypothetical protein